MRLVGGLESFAHGNEDCGVARTNGGAVRFVGDAVRCLGDESDGEVAGDRFG